MKRTVEIVEHLESPASLAAHAGISFFERFSAGGFLAPPSLTSLGKHKDCQAGDFCVGH
jgi:hypothetical protein